MAITETRIIQVNNDPSIINRANAEWGKFGWSVLNVEVTHSQNTKTYTPWYGGDYDVVETTTINYATITYQRDKLMPNYSKIVALEQEFIASREQLADEENKKLSLIKAAGRFGIKNIIILAVLILSAEFLPGLFLQVIALLAAIAFLIFTLKMRKSRKDSIDSRPEVVNCNTRIIELNARLEAITLEAAKLMNIA